MVYLGKDIFSISKRPLKVHCLNLHMTFLCRLFFSVVLIAQQAALWLLFYSPYKDWQCLLYIDLFLVHVWAVFRIFTSLESFCVRVASYLLWNWMKPQAQKRLTDLRLMLHVLVGRTNRHKTIQVKASWEKKLNFYHKNKKPRCLECSYVH